MRIESPQSMQDNINEDLDQRSLLAALDLLEKKGELNRKDAKEMLLLILKQVNEDEKRVAGMDNTARMSKILAEVTNMAQSAKERSALNKIMEDMEALRQLGEALSNSGAKMDAKILGDISERADRLVKEMRASGGKNKKGKSGLN